MLIPDTVPIIKVPYRRRQALKKRLLALLALAMMLSATVAGPASATPSGYNPGNHYGDIKNQQDKGEHIGQGTGLGRIDNNRRGLK